MVTVAAPTLVQLSLVSLSAAPAYLITMRLCFPTAWNDARKVALLAGIAPSPQWAPILMSVGEPHSVVEVAIRGVAADVPSARWMR